MITALHPGEWRIVRGEYLAPPIITITANTAAFHEAMDQARLSMAVFGEAFLFYPAPAERPVDRARRLHVERAMRARDRRAARRARRIGRDR